MNDETLKQTTDSAPQQIKEHALSRLSADIGIGSILVLAISLAARLIWGTDMSGFTAYGEGLFQHGLPPQFAAVLDYGNMSLPMEVATVFGLFAFILGAIALFLKGRKRLAIIGVVTGGLVASFPFLLALIF